jgi:hypothetical protein
MEIDDQDDSIAIIPEFNLDDVVTSIQDPICTSPINRQQKKSFKYLNKFQKVRKSRDLKVTKATPKTQRKRGNGFKLNSNEPMTAIKRSEFLKNRLKNVKRESSSRRSKNAIKSKCNIDPISERLLNSFYQLVIDSSNKAKILEVFKSTGKGGVIEIHGEPIFPLKMTLDYLLQSYNG